MLNIIYAGSLAVAVAIAPAATIRSLETCSTFIGTQHRRLEPTDSLKARRSSPELAALTSKISPTQEQFVIDRLRLAKGRRYESDYRNEADRARERHQNDREHYRYDPYEVEYDREGRGRIHRDAEQRRREENLESEQPRYRHRNRPSRSRDRSQHRGHRSIYYRNHD